MRRAKERFPVVSGIRPLGGVPTLMAGSTPLPAPVFCLLGDQAFRHEVVRALYRHGVTAFAVRNSMGVGDNAQTDATIQTAVARLAAVARAAPKAWLLADCDFFPSEAWMIAHPHEGFITADSRMLVLGRDGASDRRDYIRVPGPSLADVKGGILHGEDARILYGRRRVSPFSESFARGTKGTVRRFLAALEEKGLTDRLWGFFVGCYIYGEWNLFMTSPDQSRAALRGFRRYLGRRYGDDQSLRASWADPFVTLTNATPPREYAKLDVPPMKLETPRHADYQGAEAWALAEQFSIMASGIKALGPRFGVGGFFPGANPPQSDWFRLVRKPAVDFLATPIAYENRGPGCGVGSQCPFCDGFATVGKVWFHELDTRTLRADKAVHYCYGRARTMDESLGLLWRDAGQMLIRGHHGWWLDFGHGGKPPYSWHLDPEVLDFHRRFTGVWRKLGDLDRRPLGEIKVFIPSEASRHFQILYHADYQRYIEWTLLGAPVEWEVLENLIDGRAKLGKLNVIYGAACLSAAALRNLGERLRGKRSFVVWMDGAGLYAEGRPVESYRAESVIPVRQEFALMDTPVELEAQPTPEGCERLGLPAKLRMGQYYRLLTSGFVKSPRELNIPMKRVAVRWKLTVTDPEAIPLARQASGDAVLGGASEDERPERIGPDRQASASAVLVAMKKKGGITHVVYNLPVLNTPLLRALAQAAGCHLFTRRDDVVFASKGLVLLHATYSGTHRLFFPGRTRLVDLVDGTRLAAEGAQIALKLRRGDTRLFKWQ